jgi:formamidopyrimidine-DNA glycosylase
MAPYPRTTSSEVRVINPFPPHLRSPLDVLAGTVKVSRQAPGARSIAVLRGSLLVMHLMIAGRLQWKPAACRRALAPRHAGAAPASTGISSLASSSSGTLFLTEAGSLGAPRSTSCRQAPLAALDPRRRCRVHLRPVLRALQRENRALKQALTDPPPVQRHRQPIRTNLPGPLSPFKLTEGLSDDEISRLHQATVAVLRDWTERLAAEAREDFPQKVTAFRPDMAVHGKYGSRCPVCGEPVQRIVYADNECDYCPGCQTGEDPG